MGSAPDIPTVNPNKVVSAILSGFRRELPQFNAFQQDQPNINFANQIAQSMFSGLGAELAPLQGLLGHIGQLTGPLQAALSRDAGIVATGGRMTPSEAAIRR